jgi:hypothetical protein
VKAGHKSKRMVYPVADDFDIPVWVLPGLGYMAQNFIEGKNQLLS